jgi:hypothetical protein
MSGGPVPFHFFYLSRILPAPTKEKRTGRAIPNPAISIMNAQLLTWNAT